MLISLLRWRNPIIDEHFQVCSTVWLLSAAQLSTEKRFFSIFIIPATTTIMVKSHKRWCSRALKSRQTTALFPLSQQEISTMVVILQFVVRDFIIWSRNFSLRETVNCKVWKREHCRGDEALTEKLFVLLFLLLFISHFYTWNNGLSSFFFVVYILMVGTIFTSSMLFFLHLLRFQYNFNFKRILSLFSRFNEISRIFSFGLKVFWVVGRSIILERKFLFYATRKNFVECEREKMCVSLKTRFRFISTLFFYFSDFLFKKTFNELFKISLSQISSNIYDDSIQFVI